MKEDFYPIPPSFGALMKRQGAQKTIEKISVEVSIAQHIRLYLSTRPGEYFFDGDYGCLVHQYDFRQLSDTPSKDQLKRSVATFLEKFEKRILVNNLSIDIEDVQEKREGGSPRICRYVIVTLAATLAATQLPLKEMKFRLVRYA